MNKDEKYIYRALDLARLGTSKAAPNPLVGAVIVHQDRIIGEGWHQEYGKAHAEVNAVNSVAKKDLPLLPHSTIYVSLEPCTIFGKTPPCTNLIIEKKIPNVVISTVDKTEGVDGTSKSILEAAGCQVTTNILESEGKDLARVRNTFVSKKRPYIILKFAQSADGFIGQEDKQVWLTNSFSKRLVHKWRSEVAAILVGTNTAILDNPKLTNRLYFGQSPLRIVLDKKERIPKSHHLLQDDSSTWIYTTQKDYSAKANKKIIVENFDKTLITKILEDLYKDKKSSLIVEGGVKTLQTFIDNNLWDECRIFKTQQYLGRGIAAPNLEGKVSKTHQILNDQLIILKKATV